MATRRDLPSAAVPPVDWRRRWRRLWSFGMPIDAPAVGVMLRWRDGLDVLEETVADDEERVVAALELADRLGLGGDVRRWVARFDRRRSP